MLDKNYEVINVGINVSYGKVFDFVSKPQNLVLWTKTFVKADDKTAVINTPDGELNIKLETIISKDFGTVDCIMTMPDGNIEKAFSRVIENGKSAIYSFVFLAPRVPLENLEGMLKAQKLVLTEELTKLKEILENP
jgi:hypothetical protein